MERREAPPTEEGWFATHDLRRIDWGAWRSAPARERDRAIREGIEFLKACQDPEEGATAVFSITGHEADLMVVHLRPDLDELDALERRFERTAFADYVARTDSFVSVTEVSGYMSEGFFEEDGEVENPGMERYIRSRLEPEIPDADYVSFYPMDKRRGEEYNWYDLPIEERAELMEGHGVIGRDHAGEVTQVITSAIGFDDWEWGVTLFANDLTEVKRLLYEMRFDPSSSRYAEFGPFYVGQRFDPRDLRKFMEGERLLETGDDTRGITTPEVSAGTPEAATTGSGTAVHHAGDGGHHGDHPPTEAGSDDAGSDDEPFPGGLDALETELHDRGVETELPADREVYPVVVYSETDPDELAAEVDGLRSNFEHYDTHVRTEVSDAGDDLSVVVSLWETESAADTASGFLAELPGVTELAGVGAESGDADDDDGETTPPAGGDEELQDELADLDVYAGKPHGEDVYAVVVYSNADGDELFAEVDGLRTNFDHYDTHVRTAVYEPRDGGVAAVASLWETESAADTAAGFMSDLPGVVRQAGDETDADTWGTMGMFYTVEEGHREEFVDKFETVGEVLAEMDGHVETDLLVNREADDEMFIASRWDSKEDAMEFFRSDDFADTVEWGRDVLADRPRHVFLA